jgi:hypothetical protein
MALLTNLEKKMIDEGLSSFSLIDMNNFIVFVANKKGITYQEVTNDTLLNYHKEIKTSYFSDLCEGDIIKGFVATNGHTYRTNRDDQVNMIGQKHELLDDELVETVMWKTEDVGYISHTREEWLGVYTEAFSHKKSVLFKYNALKQKILDAKTQEEIVSIVWE